MKKGKRIWNRLLSLVLCLVMVTGVFAGMGMEVDAAEKIHNVENKKSESGRSVTIYVAAPDGAQNSTAGASGFSGALTLYPSDSGPDAQRIRAGDIYNYDTIARVQVSDEYELGKIWRPQNMNDGNNSDSWIILLMPTGVLNVTVTEDGQPLENHEVSVNNGNKGRTDANGMVSFRVRSVWAQTVVSTSKDGYSCSHTINEMFGTGTRNVTLNIISPQDFTVNLVDDMGNPITGADIKAQASGVTGVPDITMSDGDNNGTYIGKLKNDITYGLVIKNENIWNGFTAGIPVWNGPYYFVYDAFTPTSTTRSYTQQMSMKTPAVDVREIELNVDDTQVINMTSATSSNINYLWSVEDSAIASLSGDGNSRTLTALSAGTTKVIVSAKHGTNNIKSVEIPVTVNRATKAMTVGIKDPNDNKGKTTETFTLPSNLNGATSLTITATPGTGSNLEKSVSQTYTLAADSKEVTLDLSNNFSANEGLAGPITYKFEFAQTNKYTFTSEEISQTYYKNVPFSVELATNSDSSIADEGLVYGDTRTLSVIANSDGISGSNITYGLEVLKETDVLDVANVNKTSNSTTAVSNIKIANATKTADGVTIKVTRPQLEAPYYWAEVAAKISNITVAKKVIDPLKATYSNASDETVIYDGDTSYKAVGNLEAENGNKNGKLAAADAGKAKIATTLVLPSADAGTYKADSHNIQIGNVSLTAVNASEQVAIDRNYILKSVNSTDKIEKSEDLVVNKKEINPLLPNYQKDDSEVGIYDGEKTYKVVGTVEAADGDTNGKLIVADAGKARITATLELPSDDAGTYKASSGTIAIGDAIALVAVDDKDAEHIAKNYILKSVNRTDKIEKSKDLVVTPKEIKPLVAVTYANASERVYDGTNIIEAVGTVGTYSDGGKAKDMDDVSVNATLSIIGKDVGTYTPSNEVITIKKYALSGADAKNYKLPKPIPTGKIETSGTSLIIKERPVTVSGFTADDKDYDQSTVATLSSNNVVVSNIVNGEDLNVTAKGTFTDKNVERDGSGEAINKTVNISDITLSDGTNGKASNYVLTASGNQESTTATIRPIEAKVLVTVNDKQYDGLNTATIKDAGLDGIINGDIVTLNRGTPKFNGVGEADNEQTIGISFTDFSIEGADAVNYDLTQPTGVTAKIYNDYDAKKDIDYIVNSNDWINEDFIVTAAEGHVISEADDYDGANTWNERLSRNEDITDGELKFYVRDNESGAISKSVIETYNIDTILPTGSVKIAENKWMEFWNNITFEKFFNKTQTVTITADDERSGVAKVEYYESDKELTLDEIKALREDDWTKGEKVRVTLEDTKKFVYYARITDKAGNVNYLNTDGSVYDTTLPTLKGAKEGEVYYTTQTITVKDTNLVTITLDGETVTSPVTLPGNVDKVYKLVAIDKAGNKAALSISMKPLSDLSGDITDSNVTLADEKELEKSEELLKNELEKGNLSDEEKKDVKDRLTEIQNLLQDIDEVKDVIKMLDNLPDAYLEDGETVNPYVSDRMDDEEEKLYSAVKAAYKAYNKLSAHQQSLISTGLKHNLSNLRKVLTDYRITDGDGKVWVYDTNGTITFTANGPVCRFENALVDGKKVPAEEMKVTKGSTVVELDAGYLYRLGLGDHTFQMEYTDGETDVVEFSIVTMEVWNTMMKQSGTNQTGTGAATGDSANILLWGAALAVGAIGMVVAKKRRKDKEA